VGDGNSAERGRREGGADAGHDLERDARSGQGERFFAASSEDEGVASLEPHDALAATGGANHHGVDGGLIDRGGSRALSDVDPTRSGGEIDDGLGDEGVVEDEIRFSQAEEGPYGEELGVARTRADEGDESPTHSRPSA
jgi:hypothetical protein